MKPLSLLFGMPRSGTTWVAKILDSHPEADYRHEPDSLIRIAGAPLLPEPDDAAAERAVLAFAEGLAGIRHLRVCGKQPLFPKAWAGGKAGVAALRANVLLSKAAARTGISLPLSRWLLAPAQAGHLVWKSIESVGRLGLLARAMPQVKAIFLLRHPCAHVASILRGQKVGKFSAETGPQHDRGLLKLLCASSQGRHVGLTPALLGALAADEVLAWRWRIYNDHALAQVQGLPNVLVLRYEDVCWEPQAVGRQMLEFIGLGWHPQCADFIAQSVGGTSDGYYSVNKHPLVSASKWRSELAPEGIDRILGVVQGSRAGAFFGQAN